MTYNQVIKIIEDFANTNAFIESFGDGNVQDISTSKDTQYPLLWAEPSTSTNQVTNASTLITNLGLNIYMLDRVNMHINNTSELNGDSTTNEREVMSDRLQILNDLIVYLRQNKVSFGENITINPIYDDVDITSGWLANINIILPYSGCYSGLPLK